MVINMYNRNDEHSGASSRSRYDYHYHSTSSPPSSVENQRYNDHTSLFGDPVLPATRHTDLLEGGDLYQNLKNNIELYHSKLYNEQEKLRQAERDRMFNEFTSGNQRMASSTTTSSSVKNSIGSNTTHFENDPVGRYPRTRSANHGIDFNGSRSTLQNMDMLKHNEWINFSEYEYLDSLIPTTSQTLADIQQFSNNNLNRTIENGVFQNPRIAALRSRRNSMSDNIYAMSTASGYSVADNVKPSTFTILGHGANYSEAGIAETGHSNSSEGLPSEYERMLRISKSDATTPIIKDKVTTGSNFRISEARQHKKPAFTIINETLPKSNSFDVSMGPFLPYQSKQRLAALRVLSASSVGTFHNRQSLNPNITSDDTFLPYHRRYSNSEVTITPVAKRKKSTTKKGGESKRTKKKHTIAVVNPSREQKGILGVLNRAKLSPNMQQRAKSAKLLVTAASEDGQSPTPSEMMLDDRIDIPEHQMRNMKLFSYKPFAGRPMLSPVPDKSSMENSQIDLKEASPAKGKGEKGEKGEKGGYLRAPMFNIRGLLSPGRSKGKDSSPGKNGKEEDKKGIDAVSGLAAMTTVTAITSIAGEGKQAADSKPPEDPPKKRRFNLAKAIIDYGKKSDEEEKKKEEPVEQKKTKETKEPKETVEEQPKARPEVKRDGRRKDSEGNRVKDGNKKAKGKSKKTKADDYNDYYEQEKPKKGMLKSALNLASNLTGKGNGSKKDSTKTVRSDRVGSGKQDRRSARVVSGRVAAPVKSGKASERSSRVRDVREKSAKASGKPAPKSASGPKGKTLRRSSSASALNVDSVKKMNRLYEKNVKAADRNGKTLKGDKKSRQSSDSLLSKSDSKGELKLKTVTKSPSTKAIEKRDSEKSLKMKKSDSNKSLSKMVKKSDSKGSLFGKRSDSKTSLHLMDTAMGSDSPAHGGGGISVADVGKNVLNTVNEVPGDNSVKSTRVTPRKLQSKGSLLSLLSFKSVSHRNVADADRATPEPGRADSRPGTATAARLKSASVRNVNEKPGTPVNDSELGSRISIREKPGSSKLIRKDLSRTNSRISMKSVAHARSFISIRPSANDENNLRKNDSMPQMTKVKEGSQEHDDDDDFVGEKGKTMMTPSATHVMTVAGDGEGMKVANEFAGTGHSTGMNQEGINPNTMENQPSANTDMTMTQKNHSDEFDETGKSKCCACCAPCWRKTCLPFKRCFSCSSCCGKGKDKDKQQHQAPKQGKPEEKQKTSCWQGINCCRSCRRSKTSPAEAQPAATPKKSCWQSLNCCASCRRNKSRELVPRSSIDSEPEERTSKCRSCWSRLLCCSRFRKNRSQVHQQRLKMQQEPVEMETVKCCFCCKRTRPKLKPKKKKVPVKSSFNCLSCCIMCCPKKNDNGSRRTSNLSKKQSIAPTIPPEDLRPKIDMTLVEHSSLMRGAIPVLPICLAYFCLFLNVVIPGSGTILSGCLCLCIGKPRFSQHDSIKGRIGSFIINCIVGVSQCFTIIFCVVGWGWAIWWGTIMVRLAKQHRKILEMEAAQEDGEEQTTLSQRTGASNPPVAMVSQANRRDVETGR
ncbi:protein stum [Toxorhynchites rutilus septentrionalis]|uniref:protein stum n=1 Tax=Toxorhynchites rutilus septentrionalis TaxID=329112 RepID=UPI002478C3A9|nr:protein stum [Toxorhynchites rutilus septentrionalis]XP_055621780.1 protein stum [Toxorhynchites rutilus septentrionalis]